MSQQIKKRRPSNVFLVGLAALAIVAITAAYAYQTYQFISWLMPADDWMMKSVSMFSFDGCCAVSGLFDLFWPFRMRRAKDATFNMWIFTLGASTLASIIQMYLSSTHLIPQVVPLGMVYLSDFIVILVFVINIVAIYYIFRLEWIARHPEGTYDDDEEFQAPAVRVSMAQTAPMPAISTAKTPGLLDRVKKVILGDEDEPQPASQPVARTRPRRQIPTAKDRAMKYRGRVADPTPAPGKQQRSQAKKKLPAMKK